MSDIKTLAEMEADGEIPAVAASMYGHIVLVDMVESDVPSEELFGVVYAGVCRAKYDDPIVACEHAKKLAGSLGVRWEVTLHARNAADMS